MGRELRAGGFGLQNLLNVLIVGAIMFIGQCHVNTDVRGLGPDFARGHGTLPNAPDLSMANFHYGVTHGLNVEDMTDLCASTGVVNMGVHRGHLYVMFKWMVSSKSHPAGNSIALSTVLMYITCSRRVWGCARSRRAMTRLQ
jgi:hypothetical protein